jgi:hypothetical protein
MALAALIRCNPRTYNPSGQAQMPTVVVAAWRPIIGFIVQLGPALWFEILYLLGFQLIDGATVFDLSPDAIPFSPRRKTQRPPHGKRDSRSRSSPGEGPGQRNQGGTRQAPPPPPEPRI